jgi:hypothetical protein
MALTLHGTVSDNTVALDRKNATPIVYNGDMQIAQRGTSHASITGSGYFTVDRFSTGLSNLGTWTMSQDTDVPTGQGFVSSLKLDCTSADASPASGDIFYVHQPLEGQDLQLLKKGTSSAEYLTIAFWVKSAKTGTHIVELVDDDNTRHISQAYTISSANTWEKKVLSYAGDTSGALGNDNGRSLMLTFWLGAGTDWTSGTLATSWASKTNANRAVGQVNLADNTSNNFLLTGIQAEVGNYDSGSLPPFQFEDVGTSLRRCQRFYYRQGFEGNYHPLGSGVCENTSSAYIIIDLPTKMRANPSASFSGNITLFDGDTFNTSSSIGATAAGSQKIRLSVTANSGVANGHGATLHVENSSSYVEFTSEL